VVNRKAARSCGRKAAERNAIVIDRFFDTKQKALAWAKSQLLDCRRGRKSERRLGDTRQTGKALLLIEAVPCCAATTSNRASRHDVDEDSETYRECRMSAATGNEEPHPASAVTLIEIRLHRWGWKSFEAPGVQPIFLNQE
jgi:hypothetical protein